MFANTGPCALLQHLGSAGRGLGPWYRLWLLIGNTVPILGRTAVHYLVISNWKQRGKMAAALLIALCSKTRRKLPKTGSQSTVCQQISHETVSKLEASYHVPQDRVISAHHADKYQLRAGWLIAWCHGLTPACN